MLLILIYYIKYIIIYQYIFSNIRIMFNMNIYIFGIMGYNEL